MDKPVVWVISPHSNTRQLIGLNLSKRGLHTLEIPWSDRVLPDGKPDVVILDVDPPEELKGEAVRAIRQTSHLEGVPLISVLADPPSVSRLFPFEPVRWVKKPLAIDALLTTVQESLAHQGRRYEMNRSHESLADRVRAIPGGEHLYMCYSCGTCVGNCPIQSTGELTYNPRRLIQKVINGLEQEAFEDRTTWLCSACDLCYPMCPQKIHVSGVMMAVKELAVQAGARTQINTASVNKQTCVACGLCVEVCPYEAISLAEREVAGHVQISASVDAEHCMACGLCVANCRSSSIELADQFSSEALMDNLWQWMHATAPKPIPLRWPSS